MTKSDSQRRSLEALVLKLAALHPELGQFSIAESLRRRGKIISPSGVRSILKRHRLETVYKRLSALERRAHEVDLTDAQYVRLRRARVSEKLHAHARERATAGKQSRRQQLLTLAARAFARRGYQDTTLQDVAQAAGILPGSIYHYFRSKDDLFAEVHREGFRQLNAAVDRAIAGAGDPWRRLEAALAVHIQGLVSGTAIMAFTGGTMFSRDRPNLHRRLLRERDAYEDRIRAMVEALPLPPEIDRRLLRLSLLGACNWTQLWYKPGKKSPAEIAHGLVDAIRRR